jgi:hypothetical protein
MIVWTGLGLILPLICLLILSLFGHVGGLVGFPAPYKWLLGGIFASALLWYCGAKVNDPSKDRTVVDAKTGEKLTLKKRHTLFFMPVQWWSLAVMAMALSIAFDPKPDPAKSPDWKKFPEVAKPKNQ